MEAHEVAAGCLATGACLAYGPPGGEDSSLFRADNFTLHRRNRGADTRCNLAQHPLLAGFEDKRQQVSLLP
jgi:hypothetical protein